MRALLVVTLMMRSASAGHMVHQQVYDNADCSGSPSSTGDFSGDKVCFTDSAGGSEDIQCDADNAAMHVTLYSDTGCATYVNAFSYATGGCHNEPSLGRSFTWSCSGGVKTVAAKATVTAPQFVV